MGNWANTFVAYCTSRGYIYFRLGQAPEFYVWTKEQQQSPLVTARIATLRVSIASEPQSCCEYRIQGTCTKGFIFWLLPYFTRKKRTHKIDFLTALTSISTYLSVRPLLQTMTLLSCPWTRQPRAMWAFWPTKVLCSGTRLNIPNVVDLLYACEETN